DGYDRVPAWLAEGFGDRIQTETVVERVQWERGNVELTVRERNAAGSSTITARAVIVTVPLGVLLAAKGEPGRIEFSPRLPAIDELPERLAMGHVIRVALLFRDRWWTEPLRSTPRNASLDSLSFVHGDAGDLRVWWTLHPAHVPVMVGWVGGPRAVRLVGRSADEIRDRAVASLALNFGASRRHVSSRLEAFWTHDWQTDPFSRGAYSYALVGGSEYAA